VPFIRDLIEAGGGAERCWEVVVALEVAMYGSAEEC